MSDKKSPTFYFYSKIPLFGFGGNIIQISTCLDVSLEEKENNIIYDDMEYKILILVF